MTLSELRYIVALAQKKHFGDAAKASFVSQPTLSIAINKLEEELGVKIFERQYNEVRITEVGEKIIAQAQRVLEEAGIIKEIAEGGKSQLNSPLKIGGIYTVAPYLFPQLIPKIKKYAPKMPLFIHEDYTANLKAKLLRGELDAIFVALPFKDAGIVTKPLYEESFVVTMRADHPLSKKKNISSKDLKSETILMLGEGHCFRNQVMKACPSCYKTTNPEHIIEGSSLETLRHMVASGFGITILPSSATHLKYYQTTLCNKSFKENTPMRTIALAWRSTFPRTKAIDVLIKAITDCKLSGICLLPGTHSLKLSEQ